MSVAPVLSVNKNLQPEYLANNDFSNKSDGKWKKSLLCFAGCLFSAFLIAKSPLLSGNIMKAKSGFLKEIFAATGLVSTMGAICSSMCFVSDLFPSTEYDNAVAMKHGCLSIFNQNTKKENSAPDYLVAEKTKKTKKTDEYNEKKDDKKEVIQGKNQIAFYEDLGLQLSNIRN